MTASSSKQSFRYFSCRNISAPEDDTTGRRVYAGKAPASSFIDFPTFERLDASVDDDATNSITPVHRAIRHTLDVNPDDFGVLNAGITLVVRAADVDDKNRTLLLDHPRLIDGSKTQTELRRYAARGGMPAADPHVRFEVVVCPDEDFVEELAAGRQLQLDRNPFALNAHRWKALEAELERTFPGARLDGSNLFLADGRCWDLASVFQVLLALMPRPLFEQLGVGTSKAFVYSNRVRCFRVMERIYERQNTDLADAYDYCVVFVGEAMEVYERWHRHVELLRALGVEPLDASEVPDGVVFPILASLSVFVSETPDGCGLVVPKKFPEQAFITTVAELYREVAAAKPSVFGKSSACYCVLEHVAAIFQDATF